MEILEKGKGYIIKVGCPYCKAVFRINFKRYSKRR